MPIDPRHPDTTARQRETERVEAFAAHRRYLFAVAYRMLGVAEDAEDVVQEAWIRFAGTTEEEIESPRAYLVTIVSRLCLDQLRSARRRREEYVGIWLPEPVPTDETLADDRFEQAETASFAFLLLLERLSPMQQAVLVLYDVFDYTHGEIAAALGGTAAASRQALRRARRRIGESDTSGAAPTSSGSLIKLVERFLKAARSGDVDAAIGTLAPEVVLLSDGGGRVAAARKPVYGNDKVGRFFVSIATSGVAHRLAAAELNGRPAILIYEGDLLTNAMLFDADGEEISTIYVVRNPDKLRRLAAIA